MLSDPLPLQWNSILAVTGGASTNLRRVAMGKYVGTETPFTLDTQARLQITPTIKPVGYSTIRTRSEQDFNVAGAPLGASPLPDDVLSFDITCKYNPRSHSLAAMYSLLDAHYLAVRANLPRLAAGES